MFDETLDYIHQNPGAAGFVIKAEDWMHSSVKDFCRMKNCQIWPKDSVWQCVQ